MSNKQSKIWKQDKETGEYISIAVVDSYYAPFGRAVGVQGWLDYYKHEYKSHNIKAGVQKPARRLELLTQYLGKGSVQGVGEHRSMASALKAFKEFSGRYSLLLLYDWDRDIYLKEEVN